MANGDGAAPALSFPRETFAKLTPAPFLHAHLKQSEPTRPSGRTPTECRQPTVNTGSLTHSNGSAVVRVGDTAVVCGVRAEILLASDIPHPPKEGPRKDDNMQDLMEELGLLVPNVELSTGCSPAHLPGNPPGSQAQSLSYRINSLLNESNLISPDDLAIQYTEPPTEDDLPDEGPKTVVKAYWTLYIDILCIALDGNAFDAAWAAVLAALQNTTLPNAWWDADREAILCSPMAADASKLPLQSLPVALSFATFSTQSALKQRGQGETWILADPDGFEEDLCQEALTVVVVPEEGNGFAILRLDKSGGSVIGRESLKRCIRMAEDRWSVWESVLRER
ncbi:exoribonuclease family protein [Hortaea werneckii]|uniref:Ribosomal RNA-processing protein 43 n=1 Tax=Hortaea werneckii TaxID=91943 RepID=A0A3M7GNI2_HORWE|nr:exoribonuclease family protein [Hortaea werneckii]KAI7563017.1 exoribonuclease family protein [Hortaea werneckii]KAI7612499.1 exoribonuclease family protein [Hortaea werneckii]KAI7622140.1 exoribonuclease family protein [Hortaea werneckii]KAI7664126.1 exoribonuclease family protein [Hortaea werneckii]